MKKLSAILAAALVLVMVLSMLPMGAAAASNWTEVELSAVTASDSIAIVYVKDGKSYVMLNNAEKGPLKTFDASSTDATNEMLWNVTAVSGGYNIKPQGNANSYLYLINDNNGVRVSTTSAVWSLSTYAIEGTDYTYLTTKDTSSNLRTLCIYFANNVANNFRCYKLSNNMPNNTGTKQTVKFYKWTGGSVTDTRKDLPTEQTKIVDAIFNLTSGEALSKYYKYTGEITLTGTVSGSTTWYDDYSNGNVNFKVKDSSGNDKIMQAYKLSKGTDTTNDDVKNLTTGDTITVKGSVIKNFSGTYELDTCTLVSVTKSQIVLPNLPTDASEIVDAIYNLSTGDTLDAHYTFESFTLTGTVVGTASWDTSYNNGQLTFKVNGTDKQLVAYRFKAGELGADVAKALTEGDVVTFKVTGTPGAKNYNGTYEIMTPTLLSVEKVPASGTGTTNSTATAGTQAPGDTGDSTGIVGMTAIMVIAVTALAALVIGNKKRMF